MQVAVQPLVNTTGNTLADRTVQGIIALFELLLPHSVCSCYVEGSYANQSFIETSDLDLLIVLQAPLATEREQATASHLLEACQHLSSLQLDITLTDLSQLQQSADPMFKLGALLLFGREIRDAVPLIPITLWARQRMHAAFWLMVHVFQRPEPVVAPITLPQPHDVFYGYAARPVQLTDGTEIPTTRDLIRVTGWIATARIAYQARGYVLDKQRCVPTYRDTIGDKWTDLLEAIEQRCRKSWQYGIPESSKEQAELRAIAAQVLEYENHFLSLYNQFLLAELTSDDVAGQATAVEMLERTWYPQPSILAALHQLANGDHTQVSTRAKQLIKRWQETTIN